MIPVGPGGNQVDAAEAWIGGLGPVQILLLIIGISRQSCRVLVGLYPLWPPSTGQVLALLLEDRRTDEVSSERRDIRSSLSLDEICIIKASCGIFVGGGDTATFPALSAAVPLPPEELGGGGGVR